MRFFSIILIAAGIITIILTLPAAFRLKRPIDCLAALASFIGTAAALLGVLLLTVPGFFEG